MSYWKTGKIIQRGRYVIEKVLGTGGSGITYRAKDVVNEKIVAIKTLNATVQALPNFAKHQERFIQEAFRLAKCSHTHVIRVNDVCQEDDLWCMVMEYIDGGNLETLVKKQGGFSEVEAIRYIYQIGTALTYIHQQGILHRDVKPANIMRRLQNNEAVLIDFGLARDFIEDKTQIHTNSRTEGFAPIEQYQRNAKRGAYTDVYALAATLYYLLTLQIPFPAQFRQQGINLIPPQQHNPKIGDRTNLAILKGMELLPQHRPQSVKEWLTMLTEDVEITLTQKTKFIPPSGKTLPEKQNHHHPQPLPEIPLIPVPKNTKTGKIKPQSSLGKTTENSLSATNFPDQPLIPTESYDDKSIIDTHIEEIIAQTDISLLNTQLETQTPSKISAVGIDYQPLEDLLQQGKWLEADQLTQKLMLKAVNKETFGWLDRTSMQKFPCEDLQSLDRLWNQYSQGKFGFSVQKRIYLSLGGKRSYDKKVWEAVGDRLGWRKKGKWLFQEDLTYDLSAPEGHLPTIAMSGLLEGIYTLISRTMDCNL